jgi:Transposase, Mutator family
VSRICAILDEQVEAFRCRPLEGDYPYLWLDGKAEKVRAGGRVVNKCVVIGYGVHETGRREILGIDVGESETEAGDAPGCRGASRSALSAGAVRGVEAAAEQSPERARRRDGRAPVIYVLASAGTRCPVTRR